MKLPVNMETRFVHEGRIKLEFFSRKIEGKRKIKLQKIHLYLTYRHGRGLLSFYCYLHISLEMAIAHVKENKALYIIVHAVLLQFIIYKVVYVPFVGYGCCTTHPAHTVKRFTY